MKQPQLTAQRFIPDEFSDVPGATLYRSGDVGRWRADGNVDYIGRNDLQVKIRGFRVEPAEVETVLSSYEGVKQVAVVPRADDSGEKRLVAYVVIDGSRGDASGQVASGGAAAEMAANWEELFFQGLRKYAEGRLPSFMVPSALVALERLPLTPNGKLAKHLLPEPTFGRSSIEEYAEPRGHTEVALAQIWKELLHAERVGREDNFFELGGHSMSAMKLIVAISDRIKADLTIQSIFRSPKLSAMAQAIESRLSEGKLHTADQGCANKVHESNGPRCDSDVNPGPPSNLRTLQRRS